MFLGMQSFSPPPPARPPVRRSNATYVAPVVLVERFAIFVHAYGLVQACAMLNVSRETGLRIMAGLGVRRGSIASAMSALDARDVAACARREDGPR